MAIITEVTCAECNSVFFGVEIETPICNQCVVLKEIQYFEELDKLPLAERLRKIEKWIYHYKPPSMGYLNDKC